MLQLTHDKIDTAAVLDSVATVQAGAVVLFLGTVRELTEGRQTASLDYECYPTMAEKKLLELASLARERWPVLACTVVHRLGHLDLGEVAVAVAVSTPHRADAFEAARWLMDTIKQDVPIWKKEHWSDGASDWVHPGIAPEVAPPK